MLKLINQLKEKLNKTEMEYITAKIEVIQTANNEENSINTVIKKFKEAEQISKEAKEIKDCIKLLEENA